MPAVKDQKWTIAASGTVSSASIDTDGLDVYGMDVPTMTGTAISFKGSDTDSVGDARVMSWEGEDISFTVSTSAGRGIGCLPDKFWQYRYIWVVSNGAEAAARTIVPKFRSSGRS